MVNKYQGVHNMIRRKGERSWELSKGDGFANAVLFIRVYDSGHGLKTLRWISIWVGNYKTIDIDITKEKAVQILSRIG